MGREGVLAGVLGLLLLVVLLSLDSRARLNSRPLIDRIVENVTSCAFTSAVKTWANREFKQKTTLTWLRESGLSVRRWDILRGSPSTTAQTRDRLQPAIPSVCSSRRECSLPRSTLYKLNFGLDGNSSITAMGASWKWILTVLLAIVTLTRLYSLNRHGSLEIELAR